MSFARWQPEYSRAGVACFPVTPDKTPAIRNYLKIGHPGSAQLVRRFGDAEAFGFALGRRSGLTILDIDTPDERVLADALDRHGSTPIVVRSASGNWQAWYRHDGERRLIRPDPERPIDILGGGFVVAPPSRVTKGEYGFVQGGLEDFDPSQDARHGGSTACHRRCSWCFCAYTPRPTKRHFVLALHGAGETLRRPRRPARRGVF